MNCKECKELLSAYYDKVLSEEETQNIEKHLAICLDCAEEYEALQEMLGAFGEEPPVSLPEGLHDDIMKQIRSEAKTTQKLMKFRRPYYRRWAMGLVATLLIGVIWFDLPQDNSLSVQPVHLMEENQLSRSIPVETQDLSLVPRWLLTTTDTEMVITYIEDYVEKSNLTIDYLYDGEEITGIYLHTNGVIDDQVETGHVSEIDILYNLLEEEAMVSSISKEVDHVNEVIISLKG